MQLGGVDTDRTAREDLHEGPIEVMLDVSELDGAQAECPSTQLKPVVRALSGPRLPRTRTRTRTYIVPAARLSRTALKARAEWALHSSRRLQCETSTNTSLARYYAAVDRIRGRKAGSALRNCGGGAGAVRGAAAAGGAGGA